MSLIIVAVVLTIIAIYFMFQSSHRKEGFVATAEQLFQQGADAQTGLPQVYVNGSIPPPTVVAAAIGLPAQLPGRIGQSSSVNPATALVNISAGTGALASQSAMCRSLKKPLDITRSASDTLSCGWLFPPNNAAGFAVAGTQSGPVLPEHAALVSSANYTWQWNPTIAQIEEDRRECARITSCAGLTARCGWCAASGSAIPINPDGSLKYPGTMSCGSVVVTAAGSCPAGASTFEPAAAPAADGTCGAGCIRNNLLVAGCDADGALAAALANGTNPATLIQVKDLATRNFMIGAGILNNGSVTQSQALTEIGGLIGGRASADTVVSKAVTSLCNGGITYDACSAAENGAVMPSSECQKQIWTASGCSLSRPIDKSVTTAANAPAARAAAAAIYNAMSSTNVAKQEDAIKTCLGLNLIRPPPPDCGEPGVEVLYYNYVGSQSPGQLIGRDFFIDGFPSFDTQGYVLNSGLADRVQIVALMRVRTPAGAAQDIRVRTDDGAMVTINGVKVINSWQDQGPAYYSASAALRPGTTVPVRVDWYENYGGATLQLSVADTSTNVYKDIPVSWMLLQQPSTYPLLLWKFYNSYAREERSLISTVGSALSFVSTSDGGRGLKIGDGAAAVSFTQLPVFNKIAAIAMNIYVNSSAVDSQIYEIGTAATGRIACLYLGGNIVMQLYPPGATTATYTLTAKMIVGRTIRVVYLQGDGTTGRLYVDGKVITGRWTVGNIAASGTGIIGSGTVKAYITSAVVDVFAIYDSVDLSTNTTIFAAGTKE